MKMSTAAQLEADMIRYRDLARVPVAESGDALVVLDSASIRTRYLPTMTDMRRVFGNRVMVRKTVADKLLQAQQLLRKINKKYSLCVTYGYRSAQIQENKFKEMIISITKKRFFPNPTDLYEEAHRFIAVPSVAGHPTGGAVDVVITNTQTAKFLDMGSKIYDFRSKNCYVFAKVSVTGRKNRLLLRNCMLRAGFAPFDGEWWHFSYGDREWARYYKKKNALYGQLSIKQAKQALRSNTI